MSDDVVMDPYAVLGVGPEASAAEITRAYRRLLRAHHPDLWQEGPSDPHTLTALLDAYAVLRDPTRRAAYDRRHRHGGQPAVPLTVRCHTAREPQVRAGPVRRHPT